MDNFKELASFGIFAALSGFSFGAIFFGIAFVYSAINILNSIVKMGNIHLKVRF